MKQDKQENANVPPNAPKEKMKIKSKGVQGPPARNKNAGKKSALPQGAGMEIVLARSEHYKSKDKNMMRVVIIQVLAIFGLVATFLTYVNTVKPHDIYFATTPDGRKVELVPLNQPNMQPAALLSWTAQAATEIMTFGFSRYRDSFQKSSRHFTPSGWENFLNALKKARIIEGVEASQQIVTAIPKSAPVITAEGLQDGVYQWMIQLTLLVTYQSGAEKKTTTMTVYLTVVRVPTTDNPNGVGISQWIGI